MRGLKPALAVLLVIGGALTSLARGGEGNAAPRPALVQTATATTVTAPAFGVNMALFTAGDELMNDPSTQRVFRQWGISFVRVPMRGGLSDAVLTKALTAVLAVGATPVVILAGPTSSLADDQHQLGLVKAAYGSQRVILEYGNEADLNGTDAVAYATHWNAVIPVLKNDPATPPSYQFAGPVNFQTDPAYAATFARLAKPAPDLLSWHEYACARGDDFNTGCLGNLANWATDATDVENAVQAAVGHTIPFLISEFNMDSLADPRYDDPAAMTAWTTRAMTELQAMMAPGGGPTCQIAGQMQPCFAGAMIYAATDHGNFGLIDSGRVTAQGMVFRDLALRSAGAAASTLTPAAPTATPAGASGSLSLPSAGTLSPSQNPTASPPLVPASAPASLPGSSGSTPPPPPAPGVSPSMPTTATTVTAATATATTVTATPSGAATGGAQVGFEDGLDGWAPFWGYDEIALSQTAAVHIDGTHALKIATTGTAYVAAGTQSGVSGLRAGQTIVFQVYASGGAGVVRPFVMGSDYAVHFPANDVALPRAAGWFILRFTVPSGVAVHAIGLQVKSTAANWIALDGLSWPG